MATPSKQGRYRPEWPVAYGTLPGYLYVCQEGHPAPSYLYCCQKVRDKHQLCWCTNWVRKSSISFLLCSNKLRISLVDGFFPGVAAEGLCERSLVWSLTLLKYGFFVQIYFTCLWGYSGLYSLRALGDPDVLTSYIGSSTSSVGYM